MLVCEEMSRRRAESRVLSGTAASAAVTPSLGRSHGNSCAASRAFALIKTGGHHMRRCDRNATFSIYFLMGAPVVQLRLPSFTDADVSLATTVPSSTDSAAKLHDYRTVTLVTC